VTLQYVSSKTVLPVTSLEKYAGIPTHVFQIGGQANQVQYHGHLNPLSLTVLDIFLWGFVNVYFLLLLASVDDLWARIKVHLQKLHQTSCITARKKFIIDGVFVMLHLKVTLSFNSDRSDKT
jgi:hypothetical protein